MDENDDDDDDDQNGEAPVPPPVPKIPEQFQKKNGAQGCTQISDFCLFLLLLALVSPDVKYYIPPASFVAFVQRAPVSTLLCILL